MASLHLILFGIFFLTLVKDVHSACLQGEVSSAKTKYGTNDIQCSYKGMKILPGSTLKLPAPDCLQCSCTAKGMTCCGFGFAAGVVAAPPGCVAHNDACKLIFVKANNLSEICKSEKNVPSNKKKLAKPI